MADRRIMAMPGNEVMADALAARLGARRAVLDLHRFPDGESLVRIDDDLSGAQVDIVCTLSGPDALALPLIFAARTAREFGAASVGLVAPYLAYMRQDVRFRPGEAVTSVLFADLVSREFDRLVTVDPHLHRHKSLSDIYRIPALALGAAPLLADWVRDNVQAPLIVGPDEESAQWVAEVASRAGAPHVVLRKVRHGDRDVEIAFPDMAAFAGRQAVLVDDIISSGRSMIEAARGLSAAGFAPPVCVAVHPLFAEGALGTLSAAVARVVSTDSVPHGTNAITLAPLIADALHGLETP